MEEVKLNGEYWYFFFKCFINVFSLCLFLNILLENSNYNILFLMEVLGKEEVYSEKGI